MQKTIISLMRWPGGENEGGGIEPANESANTPQQPGAEGQPTEKGFIAKIKDALQEWSNDDQQEQDEDDVTP